MTTLDKIKAEIEQNAYPIVHGVNNHEKGMTLYGILQIFDKYAKRQKCDTCYHNKTEFSVCQYCTDGDKYEKVDEWQNGYDMAWEEAEVFYEKEEPISPCDLCRFDCKDICCLNCPAMAKGGK